MFVPIMKKITLVSLCLFLIGSIACVSFTSHAAPKKNVAPNEQSAFIKQDLNVATAAIMFENFGEISSTTVEGYKCPGHDVAILNDNPYNLADHGYWRDTYKRYWDKNFAYDNYVKPNLITVRYIPKLC